MFDIRRDPYVKKEWYYCVLGVSKRKVVYGSSKEIVERKCLREIEKGEVSFEPFPKQEKPIKVEIDDLPF